MLKWRRSSSNLNSSLDHTDLTDFTQVKNEINKLVDNFADLEMSKPEKSAMVKRSILSPATKRRLFAASKSETKASRVNHNVIGIDQVIPKDIEHDLKKLVCWKRLTEVKIIKQRRSSLQNQASS